MNAKPKKYPGLGITVRTALLSWLVTAASVLLFALVIIPMQKRIYLENMESKARSLAVSLHNVAAGAIINEDFSSVVDHCKEMLDGDKALDYLIITKNDGFSLISDRAGWRSDTDVHKVWRPDKRAPVSGIGVVPQLNRRVFYYSQPFDYSGIQWGWIHVGLSVDDFDRSIAAMYQRTCVLAVVCIIMSLLASVFYAKHLVRPILNLRQVVQQVAGGNLAARALVDRGDELGSLAGSVNIMTESLRRRDSILESMRFAAQKFLSSAHWETVVNEVLAKIGEADEVSRVAVLHKEILADGKVRLKGIHQWESPSCPAPAPGSEQHGLTMLGVNLDAFLPFFEKGTTLTKLPPGAFEIGGQLVRSRGVKAFILMPITVDGAWWGVFSLADCLKEREWTQNETESFRAIADMFGAAIERQQIQNALVTAKESAEAASHAKSQFLANMSHEIRTPITGVLGMLQLLQQTDLNKHQARYAANAFTSAKTLLTVIGDVLDFSKIEAGKMELEEHPFDPAEVVDTVMRLFAERAEDKGIELAFRVGQNVSRHLQGDSNRLRQILVNLVGNAVKFTSRGEVLLTCQRQDHSLEATTLRFEVRDTGCGIDAEKLKLIFDPFAQADNSMARKYGGTGLGLTISRQFCELMGGRIAVESAPGRGSTFAFALRFKNLAASVAGAGQTLLDLRRLRVLVVDDCAITREINCEWIAAWQGDPDDAADAMQGLEKLRRAADTGRPFQVALLDWKMPGMDGVALAQLIKEDEQLQKTGLVLLSSYTQHGGFEKITAAGFASFVPKPAGRSDLYDAIVTAANGELQKLFKPTAETRTSSAVVRHPGTILLAEDNAINREVAIEMLSTLGYQSRWVRNGRDAVEVWHGGRIDLILMDCQMPEMDGYEATRAIRSEEAGCTAARRIPIVALTAHATNGDRERCLAAGMDDYLTKPLDPETLRTVLAKWMSAGPATDAGPIDFPSLLQRCFGKQELAARLVRKLTEQSGHDLEAITAAVQQNDAAALAAAAHRLKGAAANVSAEALRQAAAELEELGRSGNAAPAADALDRLRLEIARLTQLERTESREQQNSIA